MAHHYKQQQQQHRGDGGSSTSGGSAKKKPRSSLHHAGSKLGASLSLDKWASSRLSSYDKRQALQKARALKAKQVNKLKRLRKRLEAQGKLQAPLPLVRTHPHLLLLLLALRGTAAACCCWLAVRVCVGGGDFEQQPNALAARTTPRPAGATLSAPSCIRFSALYTLMHAGCGAGFC